MKLVSLVDLNANGIRTVLFSQRFCVQTTGPSVNHREIWSAARESLDRKTER